MKLTPFALLAVCIGLELPLHGALQFKDLPRPWGTWDHLVGVSYNGDSRIVAVGSNSMIVAAEYQPNNPSTNRMQWSATTSPGYVGLRSVTHGMGWFFAGGVNASIFVSTNGLQWVQSINAFPNSASVRGLAYNNGTYVAAGSAPEIYYYAQPWANWNPAGLPGLSILESYRDVSPYGANGFLACGIRGTIRVSSDGATNCPPWRALDITQPDLFGITAGAQGVVAVGAGGEVLFWAYGYTNWYPLTHPTSFNLNAVDYTGSEYVAVGDYGQIFSSSTGWQWSSQRSGLAAGFNANLNGVAFATTGNMKGVGFLVGANGTVVLAGTAPDAPIDPIPQTNYAGYTNMPLQAVVDPAFTNLIVVDWYSDPSGGTPLASGSYQYVPPTEPNNVANTITRTYYAEARDTRTGFLSASRTAVTHTLLPRPTATVTGNNTICNGESTIVRATLTGLGPWTVTWASNNIPYLTVSVGNGSVSSIVITNPVTPTNIHLNAFTQTVYTVSTLLDRFNNRSTNALNGQGVANTPINLPPDLTGEARITINPRPTATVTSGNMLYSQYIITNCDVGFRYGIENEITGIGPWVIRWNDGHVDTPNSAVSPFRFVREVIPTNSYGANTPFTNVYYVTNVTDAHCASSTDLGDIRGTNRYVINPRPTARVNGTNAICNGDTTVLRADLTGLGPWSVTWASNGIALPAREVASSPDLFPVTPTNPNLNTNTQVLYTIIAVQDTNSGCMSQSGDIQGGALITINPRPTATVSGTNTICNGSPTVLQADLTGLGPWSVIWASNGIALPAREVASSPDLYTVTPTTPNLNANGSVLYTVLALRDTTSGCTNNQPGEIQGGALITINPRPTATVTSGNMLYSQFAITNCDVGNTYYIENELTGFGPWVIRWNDGHEETTNSAVTPFRYLREVIPVNSFGANAPITNVYYVTNVTDAHCSSNAPGDIVGTNTFIINPRPTVSLTPLSSLCNNTQAVVQATFTGIGPFNVSWSWEQTNVTIVHKKYETNITTGTATFNNVTSPHVLTTNLDAGAIAAVFRITSLTDAGTLSLCQANAAGLGAALPLAAGPQAPVGDDVTNCVGTLNPPLSVAVPNGESVDWFTSPDGEVALMNNSLVLNVPVLLTPGTNIFYAQSYFAGSCTNTNRTAVSLILVECINSLTWAVQGTNLVVNWPGNLQLQWKPELTNQTWQSIATGQSFTLPNYWTNALTNPQSYFRLYAPTN